MDWLRCKPAMNPLQRNLDQSHNLVRPTDGMELKARTSSLVSRGWISRERNPVTGGVFLLTSFLIERYQITLKTVPAAQRAASDVTPDGLNPRIRSQKLNTMSKVAIGVSNHHRLTMLSKFGKT